jgi:hypothetical protein
MKDPEDYQNCLDCFLRPKLDAENDIPAQQIGSDNLNELIEQAEKLAKGGRFKCLVLYRWDPNVEEWDELRRWP